MFILLQKIMSFQKILYEKSIFQKILRGFSGSIFGTATFGMQHIHVFCVWKVSMFVAAIFFIKSHWKP